MCPLSYNAIFRSYHTLENKLQFMFGSMQSWGPTISKRINVTCYEYGDLKDLNWPLSRQFLHYHQPHCMMLHLAHLSIYEVKTTFWLLGSAKWQFIFLSKRQRPNAEYNFLGCKYIWSNFGWRLEYLRNNSNRSFYL